MAIAERVLERRRASRQAPKSAGFAGLWHLFVIGLLMTTVLLTLNLPFESLNWLRTYLE
jgi:hypothetical protein